MGSKEGARRTARRQERDRILALDVPTPSILSRIARTGFELGVAAFRQAVEREVLEQDPARTGYRTGAEVADRVRAGVEHALDSCDRRDRLVAWVTGSLLGLETREWLVLRDHPGRYEPDRLIGDMGDGWSFASTVFGLRGRDGVRGKGRAVLVRVDEDQGLATAYLQERHTMDSELYRVADWGGAAPGAPGLLSAEWGEAGVAYRFEPRGEP